MRKVWGFLVVAVLIVVACVFVAANYSEDSAIYECSGVMKTGNEKTGNESHPTTLFIKITQYRWWAFWDRLNGLLHLEIPFTAEDVPTIRDDPSAARWFGTGNNSVMLAPPFPGLEFGPRPYAIRENLFGIKRVDSYLVLYRWPKAGETVDLTEAGQGQFSTISNALRLKLSDEVAFGGSCKPKITD
jgi:hypothetical protein